MKTIKSIQILSTIFFFVFIANVNAQQLTEREQRKEANKVTKFTPEEIDEFQFRFQKGILNMNLPDAIEEEYVQIIVLYTVKLSRLDDLDMNYSSAEIRAELPKYINKVNTEVKSILTEAQYEKHLTNFNIIIDNIAFKLQEA